MKKKMWDSIMLYMYRLNMLISSHPYWLLLLWKIQFSDQRTYSTTLMERWDKLFSISKFNVKLFLHFSIHLINKSTQFWWYWRMGNLLGLGLRVNFCKLVPKTKWTMIDDLVGVIQLSKNELNFPLIHFNDWTHYLNIWMNHNNWSNGSSWIMLGR